MISDNGKTFKYDAENRMVEATVNAVTTRYRYDGEGRRIKKTVGTAVTRFVYGMGGELIAEHEGVTATSSTPSKEYVYGPTGMLAEVTGSEVNYLTPDHLGSPRVLTSQNGIVVNRRDFFPFGEDIGVGVGGRMAGMGYGMDSLRHRFTGYEKDEETGLDFAQARYYANTLGRFQSVDPVGGLVVNPQSLNLYTYVLNNPLGFTDPTGMSPELQEIPANPGQEIPIKGITPADGATSPSNIVIDYGTYIVQAPRYTPAASGVGGFLRAILIVRRGFEWVLGVDTKFTRIPNDAYADNPEYGMVGEFAGGVVVAGVAGAGAAAGEEIITLGLNTPLRPAASAAASVPTSAASALTEQEIASINSSLKGAEAARAALGKGPYARPGAPLTPAMREALLQNRAAAQQSLAKVIFKKAPKSDKQAAKQQVIRSQLQAFRDRISNIDRTLESGVQAAKN